MWKPNLRLSGLDSDSSGKVNASQKANVKEDYHVHCNYNDHSSRDLTVENVVQHAKEIGLTTVAFTEHVRKTSPWIPEYLSEIASIHESDLRIIAGFEAKILRDGSIDCLDRYADEYFIVASFHTIFEDKEVWMQALERAIKNPNVDVIGHIAPEPSFVLSENEMEDISSLITKNGKIVELNVKYHRPPIDWLRIMKRNGVRFHLGSDAHSLQEIGRYETISDLIAVLNE